MKFEDWIRQLNKYHDNFSLFSFRPSEGHMVVAMNQLGVGSQGLNGKVGRVVD